MRDKRPVVIWTTVGVLLVAVALAIIPSRFTVDANFEEHSIVGRLLTLIFGLALAPGGLFRDLIRYVWRAFYLPSGMLMNVCLYLIFWAANWYFYYSLSLAILWMRAQGRAKRVSLPPQ